MEIEPNEAEALDALRKVPMKDEEPITWAIENDAGNLHPLPIWIAAPIEKRVLDWAAENRKWSERIDHRMGLGKGLTPSMQRRYDEFVKNRTTSQLLFSRKDEKPVTKIRSNADWKKMKEDLFSIEIHMSDDPDGLRLQTSAGASQRLVLFQGAPMDEAALPGFLDNAGFSQTAVDAVVHDYKEKAEEMNSDEEMEEKQDADDPGFLHEAEALEALAHGQDDPEEILACSSEEEIIARDLGLEKFVRVKDFHHREEYRALQARDAVQVPPGSFISYHKSTRCWQGFFENSSAGLGFTHGGQTNRSPAEALLAVIQGLLEKHCAKCPRDKLWAKQLEAVKKISLTVAKIWI